MKSISNKFNIFGIVVVMVVALGLFIQFDYFNRTHTKEAKMITTLSRDVVGSEISSLLMRKAQVISDAADYVSSKDWNEEELANYFRALTASNPTFSMIYLGRPDNITINGSG
jgi:hypothetical protein